jgi:hypothetical protein
MYKNMLIGLVLSLPGLYAFGQSTALELRGGIGMNWLSDNEISNWIPNAHLEFAGIKSFNRFDYELGVLYELRGWASRGSFTDLNPTSSNYLHTAGFIAGSRVQILKSFKLGLRFEPTWLLHARVKTDRSRPDGKEISRRFDLSAAVSIHRTLGKRSAIQLSYRFESLIPAKQIFDSRVDPPLEILLANQGLRLTYIYQIFND